ncbi:unnamed protein product [Nippostrongylus brasiliensis]|uniref:Secreted protein n=1 Tax=Nippostrongylus brasiliensis TaxID=27835 RepID=A0A158R0P1_NIPBR|nr:unnamed protein product [Nippostrongylus brasiliensis]
MMLMLFVVVVLPLSFAQYTGGPTYGNEPGYLPDYQGDQFTNQQRVVETQALNRPFFDTIGGAPQAPPLTPAQSGTIANTAVSSQQTYSSSNGFASSGMASPLSSGGLNLNNPMTSSQPMYPANNGNGYTSSNYNPSSSYYSGSSSSSYYNPNSNSNSPTRYYDAVLNTNLGYPNQNQRQQNQYSSSGYGLANQNSAYTNTYGLSNRNSAYNTGYGTANQNPGYTIPQYGYYGSNQNMYDSSNTYNQQYGNTGAQSWCCGPSSTSCCYQTTSSSNQNSMYYYDPSLSSSTKYNNGQYGYSSSTYGSTTSSPYTSTSYYGKK